MKPASAVEPSKPAVKAPSRHQGGDSKKDDKNALPADGKRNLADTAAKVSTPADGESAWPLAKDNGVGKKLDEEAPAGDAPVAPPEAPPGSPATTPATTPTTTPTTADGGGGAPNALDPPAALPNQPAPPDPRGISGDLLDNHLQNAKQEAQALNTLTTDGHFEQVAGDDGELSLYEAQQYLATQPEASAPVKSALQTITTNGDFELLAGGAGKTLTLPKLQQSLVDQQQEVASLEAVQQQFQQFAGADGRLSRDEVQAAAAQAQDPAMKSALGWLDQNFDKTAAPSYYADPAQGGPAFDGSVNPDITQQTEGNCTRLATVYGLAQTPGGKAKLEQMIDQQADGSFNVSFPGDANQKVYQVKPEELDGKLGVGDTGAMAVATAIEKWGVDHPDVDLTQPGQVMNLLTGNGIPKDDKFRSADALKSYLAEHADAVNKGQQVMTLTGTPLEDGQGSFTMTVEHTFTVTNIDVQNNLVTYVNPWDPGKKHSIPLDRLAGDASGMFTQSWFNVTAV
jgi:hypothetical protein